MGAHSFGFAQLSRQFTPNVIVRSIPTVERSDPRLPEFDPVMQFLGKSLRSQLRMTRKKTQRNHHVSLTAAHGLGKFKDCLVRFSG